jgi:hypothetical protein
MKSLKPLLVPLVLVFSVSVAQAQEMDTFLGLSLGTGMTMGKPGDAMQIKRSPVFLEVDVGLVFDEDFDWEWTPSLILEVDGRVALGVNPTVKRVVRFKWFSFYGGLGVPFFFAPYTLLGLEAAIGGIYYIIPKFAAVVEFRANVFFIGSDLPDGSALAKLDFAFGVRVDL